ncbi:MAG: hypothetical protein IPO42_16760 [Chitinophagaceae bacterium]|nr:hypothetical protein [Chitinophagaceae bacterium]MBK9533402.1 hypothetical protein [Chitinophagaceae bacterium]
MRYSLLFTIAIFLFTACKKDKFTTAPQIAYKSISPNAVFTNIPFQVMPVLTLEVTDAEGDLGFTGTDTAKIFIKNLLTGKIDSTLRLPDLSVATGRNFKADVEITLNTSIILEGSTRPSPKTDTLFYEIYIQDFAKNKSNVLKTTDPVFIIFP